MGDAPEVVQLQDCCLEVVMSATPLLILNDGDVDPFTGEEVEWPSPTVYWSNGVVTAGDYEPLDDGERTADDE